MTPSTSFIYLFLKIATFFKKLLISFQGKDNVNRLTLKQDNWQAMVAAQQIQEQQIKLAQAGDAEAFEQILQACYAQMFRFAMRWCQNKEAAEDVTQQACIKLAQSIAQFRFDAQFSSWLYRLVINCAHDWDRKNNKYIQSENVTELIEEGFFNESACENESSRYLLQILNKIDKMGKGFKDTVILVCAEGMSHQEVAQILDVKEATVSWRLHEIRKQLKRVDAERGVING